MLLKKFFSVCLSLLVAVCFSWEEKALFGNTHYVLGEKIIERMKEPLTGANKTAFLSGMVYADIGRLKFDKLCGVPSDSRKFLETLKANVVTDQERWFVKGVEMHILQDEMTMEMLMNSFETEMQDYSVYAIRCGLVDYYFLQSSRSYICSEFLNLFDLSELSSLTEYENLCKAFKIPAERVESVCKLIFNQYYYKMNNRPVLISCDDLLIKTYSDLGVRVTKEELHKQQANMVGAFIIMTFIIGNKQELNQKIIDAIESGSDHIVTVCVEQIE